MENFSIPFNESIALELKNSKNQKFLIWCEPAETDYEIYYSLNFRKKLLQTMVLIPSEGQNNRVLVNYNFDVEVIYVNSGFEVEKTELITTEEQKNHLLDISGYKFVLLAAPGFSKLFSLIENQSQIKIPVNLKFELNYPVNNNLDLEYLKYDDILKSILEERNGHGLRSKIPSYYVWYNDILFLVGKMSFPGYAASGPALKISEDLFYSLKKSGINVVIKEAVYQRFYMSKQDQITKEATWYGMENMGKFVRNNLMTGSVIQI